VTGSCERIGIAIVGAGFFGSGLLRRLAALPDFEPRVVANRTIEHALAACQRANIPLDSLVITNDLLDAHAAVDAEKCVITTDPQLATALTGIDVVVDATGDLLVGTELAYSAIKAGKHVVAANSDVQATVGSSLGVLAGQAGVVYSDIDGDEPGLLKNLYDQCAGMGLEVLVAGNCKGVLKRYATPSTQAAFAAEHGLKPWLATAAADGTKLNLELTVAANATGLAPSTVGMHGPSADVANAIDVYRRLGLLESGGHYVEYLLGGRGVFAIARSDDPQARADFRYLKMGNGPFYLFHQPQVLIYYQAPGSILRAVRRGEATVTPAGAPVAETIAFAKRDLVAGCALDGIGGFDTYGLIVRADDAAREHLLPIGIAQYARLRRPIRKDEPISYDTVEFETDNLALELRRQQDALFAGRSHASVGSNSTGS
jgi:predicted homoserine dehydrogenase-like protein